jgi:hypothetical protein
MFETYVTGGKAGEHEPRSAEQVAAIRFPHVQLIHIASIAGDGRTTTEHVSGLAKRKLPTTGRGRATDATADRPAPSIQRMIGRHQEARHEAYRIVKPVRRST